MGMTGRAVQLSESENKHGWGEIYQRDRLSATVYPPSQLHAQQRLLDFVMGSKETWKQEAHHSAVAESADRIQPYHVRGITRTFIIDHLDNSTLPCMFRMFVASNIIKMSPNEESDIW